MTSTMQRELQELRAAAESHSARHVHLEHFAYPPGIRMAVNLTVDSDAMLLRRVHTQERARERVGRSQSATMDRLALSSGAGVVSAQAWRYTPARRFPVCASFPGNN